MQVFLNTAVYKSKPSDDFFSRDEIAITVAIHTPTLTLRRLVDRDESNNRKENHISINQKERET